MVFIVKRQQVLAKVEVTPGTDAVVGAPDVIHPVFGPPEWAPTVEMNEREVTQPSFSQVQQKAGERSSQVTFSTELKGSGTVGDVPPNLSVLLQACGFSETIVPATSVTYAPASEDIPSLTIEVLEGSVESGAGTIKRKKLLGARGTVSFSHVKGQPVLANFVFTGKYVEPDDIAAFFAVPSIGPLPLSFLDASVVILGVGTHKIQNLELDLANEIVMRNDVNDPTGNTEAIYVGRKPVGSTDPEQVATATDNFFADWTDEVLAAISYALTGATGNIVTVTAPNVQTTNIGEGDRDSIRIESLDLALMGNSDDGDDELTLVFT
jgi:hypothetical protein